MCDNEIHPGLVEDWTLTRRAFMASGAVAAGMAGAAWAAENVSERDVTIPTPSGNADAALFHPNGKGPWPAVLMWPDIVGLRPVFRDMGRRLAANGYVVLVPNPFYRSAHAPVVTGAFDFGNREMLQKLMGYRQAIPDSGIDSDATAFLAFLDRQPQTARTKKMGVQGYCMGGPFAFHSAAVRPDRIGAVGSFHGAGLVTDQPDSPHLLIARTQASWLVAIAQNDDARDPKAKEVLKATFAAAHRPATVEVYPADHGWCVPGSQAYNQTAAERAWGGLLDLYRHSLG